MGVPRLTVRKCLALGGQMQSGHRIIILTFGLILLGSLANAQTIEYPPQVPKDQMAVEEAGIGSYVLSRNHTDVDEEGEITAVAIEAFDLEGASLATCSISWGVGSKVIICIMSEGGHYQATWFPKGHEMLDLQGGGHIEIQAEKLSGIKETTPNARRRRVGTYMWSIDGTMTFDEFESDWSQLSVFFGYLLSEAEITLDLTNAKRFLYPENSRGPELGNPTSNIDFCDGETYCESSDLCHSEHFGSNPGHCCTNASLAADDCCRAYTGRGCCANTFCNSFCIGSLCNCFLAGRLYRCEPNCDGY